MLYSQHKFSNKTNTLQINKPIKALLIDLDGTIADSAPDLTAALNISLKSLGLPQYSLSETRQWIGNGLDQLLNRAITNDFHGTAEPKILALAREEFFTAYAEINGKETQLYPDITEALQRFNQAGILLACVTNKSSRFTLQLLDMLGIHELFDFVISGDEVDDKKPAPDSINVVLKHFDLSADECLMIGDSDNDIYAGNRANVDVLAVSYGYSQGVNLSELPILGMIHSINDIELNNQG